MRWKTDRAPANRLGRRRIVGPSLVLLAAVLALAGCGAGGEVTVASSGPVANVDVAQTGSQLVVRWEQTADSSGCRLDYRLDSGDAGSRSFGAIAAVPVVEQVFDVAGDVVSATLTGA